jgi:hypothetical protein
MKLAIWGTSAFGQDTVVPDNDRPTAFRNSETAECFHILFASDECSSTVLADRPAETISTDDQIATLVHFRDHVHGEHDRALRLGLVLDAELCRGALPGS